ncbi:hypothetical protein V2J09_017819 [Rumex salicifolius]
MEVEAAVLILLFVLASPAVRVEGYWCVARSDAGDDVLQAALDYACSAGADCAPIQSSGLCFLPNTFQAHASYAFNSFFQRKNMAPGSCDFAGSATLAKTDPSYGSCVYPPNPSTAGGITTATTSSTIPPATPTTNPYGSVSPTTTTTTTTDGGGGITPNFGPPISTIIGNIAVSLQFPVAVFVSSFALFLAS